ncbi:CoA-transferase family III domain-containing protein [Limtongia smithiae]|uniref:CoA-transferase family III domain-containing protein n=1 Tax=Limtongia smithiae TaxID=1125753 RepID=UPI0034CF047C
MTTSTSPAAATASISTAATAATIPPSPSPLPRYSLLATTRTIFDGLIADPAIPIPAAARAKAAVFDSLPILPCVFKECETVAALKGVEGAVAAAIAEDRYGADDAAVRNDAVSIDLQHATMFLFMAYLASVDGYTKLQPEVKKKLVDTDFYAAQSDPYRRMSANLYRTKDNKFFHIHGSLDASTTLEMIGLPSHIPGFTDYDAIISKIEGAVIRYTAAELEAMNAEHKQAGVTALPRDEFLATPHGALLAGLPIWESTSLESTTPPTAWPSTPSNTGQPRQILDGIKVLELCRIIAGPTIARILAEYGADVLKVTGPNLSDVPFFQVDGNMGKRTCTLDLKSPHGRAIFEKLVADADVIVDGYRTGAFARLGYPPSYFASVAKARGRGFVYVSENCFGFKGEWAHRPGWQQIADCVSGLAWAHGTSMGHNEPVIPPFPMSDYGTGCIGAVAALAALHDRATKGGSYWATTSLVQYDILLMNQGFYPNSLWHRIRDMHDPAVRELHYYDSVDRISATALQSCIKLRPDVFAEAFSTAGDELSDEEYNAKSRYMEKHAAPGFNGTIKVLKPVVHMTSAANAFKHASRPNGYDEPVWL